MPAAVSKCQQVSFFVKAQEPWLYLSWLHKEIMVLMKIPNHYHHQIQKIEQILVARQQDTLRLIYSLPQSKQPKLLQGLVETSF